MKRKIDFRVWDIYEKKFIEVFNMSVDGSSVQYADQGFMANNLDASDEHKAYLTKNNIEIIDEFILSQWTGLKDKNGKLVYEGDIVKCTKRCTHEVVWVEEYGGTFSGGMPAWYLSGINKGYAWTGDEEVIGNIYENPEMKA